MIGSVYETDRSATAAPKESAPGLAEVARAEGESLANKLSMLQIKGELSLRLTLAGIGLCILTGIGLLLAYALMLVSVVLLAVRVGVPPELAFLVGALLCVASAWGCWRRAGQRFHDVANLLSTSPTATERGPGNGLPR